MRKLSLSLFLMGLLLWFLMPTHSYATTNLKDIQIKNNNEDVILLFDQEINPQNVKVEYFRDIIQLSIKNVSVYPAKIISVKNPNLKKVFAYQYTPNLTRCRLTIEGSAENYQNRLKLNFNGKEINAKILPAKNTLATVEKKSEEKVEEKITDKNKENIISETKKAELLNKIDQNLGKKTDSLDKAILGKKELPNPLMPFLWLFVVLALFVGCVLAFVKLKASGKQKIIAQKLGLGQLMGKKKKLIEVIASQHLGPKKSITIVKVKGKLLVLGIANESINLIATLSHEDEIEAFLENQVSTDVGELPTPSRAAVLNEKVKMKKSEPVSPEVTKYTGASVGRDTSNNFFSDFLESNETQGKIRDQIRSKIKGLKSL